MIQPELRHLLSPDLVRPALPEDPRNCRVALQALIGPIGEPGEESFQFEAVTPNRLELRITGKAEAQWGRGYLLLEEFTWARVDEALGRLIATSAAATWREVGANLNRQLLWEFDDYRER